MKNNSGVAITVPFLISLSLLSLPCWGGDDIDTSDDPFQAHSDEPHQVQVLHQGAASLEERLRIIAGAQKTLDLEYFEFKPDQSGRLVLQALLNRATDKTRPPAHIRLMVDYEQSRGNGITPDIAQVLVNAGVEVKYFNPGNVFDMSKYNHRDHRKLIIADAADPSDPAHATGANETGAKNSNASSNLFCGGGRNMGDDYFDLAKEHSRVDRDVCVQGPLTRSVDKTFNAFWTSPLASKPVTSKNKTPSKEAAAVFTPTQADAELLAKIHQVGSDQLKSDPTYTVHSIDFVSDRPTLGPSSRVMANYVQKFLGATQKSLSIENFIYMPTAPIKKTINDLASQGKEITVMTNSPHSTSGGHVSMLALGDEKDAVKHGANMYLFSGNSLQDQPFLSPEQDPEQVVWGPHTKTLVRDDRDTSIGSFNLDSRSANINYEDQIVIYDSPELAHSVQANIQTRLAKAQQLDAKGKLIDCKENPDGSNPLSEIANKAMNSVIRIFRSQL